MYHPPACEKCASTLMSGTLMSCTNQSTNKCSVLNPVVVFFVFSLWLHARQPQAHARTAFCVGSWIIDGCFREVCLKVGAPNNTRICSCRSDFCRKPNRFCLLPPSIPVSDPPFLSRWDFFFPTSRTKPAVFFCALQHTSTLHTPHSTLRTLLRTATLHPTDNLPEHGSYTGPHVLVSRAWQEKSKARCTPLCFHVAILRPPCNLVRVPCFCLRPASSAVTWVAPRNRSAGP